MYFFKIQCEILDPLTQVAHSYSTFAENCKLVECLSDIWHFFFFLALQAVHQICTFAILERGRLELTMIPCRKQFSARDNQTYRQSHKLTGNFFSNVKSYMTCLTFQNFRPTFSLGHARCYLSSGHICQCLHQN